MPQPSGVRLVSGGQQRLALLKQRLAEQTGESAVVAQLCDTVERGDDLLVNHLRSYTLADAWGAPRRQVLDVCLHATRAGLLDHQWKLLCPLCRGAKANSTALSGIQEQMHCDTCNLDYTAYFGRSVELTFRPNS